MSQSHDSFVHARLATWQRRINETAAAWPRRIPEAHRRRSCPH
ncbi:hypothetical protein QQY66_33830 [Streptomyces sp. DG2A-72]|nr:hypothetical protein [Streptomyces sp. DG2A-72]MDO0936440.1 hypothetical protein [Streptomyces sp. DG2A-72]